MTYKTIKYEKQDYIICITFNRPEKRNAINDTMWRELGQALEEARDDWKARTILFKGAGQDFSAGQDLSGEDTALVMPPDPRSKPFMRTIWANEQKKNELWQLLFRHPKDTIAQVQGHCLGAGCEWALCCRTVVAAENAVFGDPSVRMGYAPSNPLWIWKVGLRKAKELLLTGRYIDAREAFRLGLVTMVVPTDKLEEETEKAAHYISRQQGLGGRDGILVGRWPIQMEPRGFSGVTLDLSGIASAWNYAWNMFALSATQRRGFQEDEFNFWEAREDRGMKAAIAERDAPFEMMNDE